MNEKPLTFWANPDGDEGFARADEKQVAAAFGSIEVSPKTVRDKMDSFLRDIVRIRCEQIGAEKKIDAEIDRRVEIAIKAVMTRIESDFVPYAVREAQKKIAAAVDTIQFSVKVEAR